MQPLTLGFDCCVCNVDRRNSRVLIIDGERTVCFILLTLSK